MASSSTQRALPLLLLLLLHNVFLASAQGAGADSTLGRVEIFERELLQGANFVRGHLQITNVELLQSGRDGARRLAGGIPGDTSGTGGDGTDTQGVLSAAGQGQRLGSSVRRVTTWERVQSTSSSDGAPLVLQGQAEVGSGSGAAAASSAAGASSAPEERQLEFDAKPEDLVRVNLNFFSHLHPDSNEVAVHCKGAAYPEFTPCAPTFPPAGAGPRTFRIFRFPNVSATWQPQFVDPENVNHPPPRNCPKLFNAQDNGPQGRDGNCSHLQDYTWHPQKSFQILELKDVYVDKFGVVFNDGAYFANDGCNRGLRRPYLRGHKVVAVETGFNMLYHQGLAFYHGLIEWMPQFFVYSRFFADNPGVPLLGHREQWNMYSSLWQRIVGVPVEAMNRVSLDRDEIFFVKRLYMPMYQDCGNPSPVVWRHLRRAVLTPPGGIPMFQGTFAQRRALGTPALAAGEAKETVQGLSVPTESKVPGATDSSDASATTVQGPYEGAQEGVQVPADWVVVLAKRPGTRRSIVEIKDIEVEMRRIFPSERVVVFNGSLTISEAQVLFRRAVLFVGGHGAALSNMIFMPPKAFIVEIRPSKSPNACYNSLAYACELNYYLTFGEGDHWSQVHVDVGRVTTLLENVKERMYEEMKMSALSAS